MFVPKYTIQSPLLHLVTILFTLIPYACPTHSLVPPPMLRGTVYGGGGILASLPFADPDEIVGAKPLDSNKVGNDLAETKPITIGKHKNLNIGRAIGTNGSSGNGTKLNNESIKMARDMALYLNAHQRDLIKRNPGSLLAVARAFKLAIAECQYQMRHEPWDCPIYGFSIKPTDIFGKLMSRNFKETSFIHSLLSSAITHSITRACTESMITTCGRKRTRDGGFKEDIEFGSQFAQQFMKATHESSAIAAAVPTNNNNIDRNLNNNIIVSGSGSAVSEPKLSQQTAGSTLDPLERERRIRYSINAHNDEVGRLVSRRWRSLF